MNADTTLEIDIPERNLHVASSQIGDRLYAVVSPLLVTPFEEAGVEFPATTHTYEGSTANEDLLTFHNRIVRAAQDGALA